MGRWKPLLEALEPRRLLAADLDLAFGGAGRGKAFFNLGPQTRVFATALQSDGKIVVGGSVNGGHDAFVARLNSNGALDATFGSAGMTRFDFGDGDYIDDLIVLPGGNILAGGTSGS